MNSQARLLSSRERQIKKVLIITFFLNVFIALVKIISGTTFNFLSLTSSGIESLFDGSSNILGVITIAIASKPKDSRHNYGHHKFENIGALAIALMLFGSAVKLGFDYHDILFNDNYTKGQFGLIPIASILISIAVSLFTTVYESRKGRELKSKILLADSQHTFGDMILSFGVLVSIIASYYGLYIVDMAVGGIIILYLVYLGVQITLENLNDLLDVAPTIEQEYLSQLLEIESVRNIHNFRARGNSNWLEIDFHLLLDPSLSLSKAHEIAHVVEDKLKGLLSNYSNDIEIIIHMEPDDEGHND